MKSIWDELRENPHSECSKCIIQGILDKHPEDNIQQEEPPLSPEEVIEMLQGAQEGIKETLVMLDSQMEEFEELMEYLKSYKYT